MAKYLPIVIGAVAVVGVGYLIWKLTHPVGGYAEDLYENHITFAPGDRAFPLYQNQLETYNVGAQPNAGMRMQMGVVGKPWVGETKEY